MERGPAPSPRYGPNSAPSGRIFFGLAQRGDIDAYNALSAASQAVKAVRRAANADGRHLVDNARHLVKIAGASEEYRASMPPLIYGTAWKARGPRSGSRGGRFLRASSVSTRPASRSTTTSRARRALAMDRLRRPDAVDPDAAFTPDRVATTTASRYQIWPETT